MVMKSMLSTLSLRRAGDDYGDDDDDIVYSLPKEGRWTQMVMKSMMMMVTMMMMLSTLFLRREGRHRW